MLSNGYILILIWTAIIGILSLTVNGVYRMETVNGERVRRVTPLFAVVAVLPLVIWAGSRGTVRDTLSYRQTFQSMPLSLAGITSYMSNIIKDQGTYIVSAIIKMVIKNGEYLGFIITTAIQYYFVFRIYKKYPTSCLIFVFTNYFSWIFNGMRQLTAVTITIVAFPFIIAVGAAVLFVDIFIDALYTMLKDPQYGKVVSDWESWQNDGTNVLHILVYSAPTVLSLTGLRYIRSEDDPGANICTNMSIA